MSSKTTAAAMSMDFKKLFEAAPGLFLVLHPNEPTYTILGVSNAYAEATRTNRDEMLGRPLFEVFPDNPEDPNATGVFNLHASLRRVLATKAPDAMAVQKYDIRRPAESGGGHEDRYWSPVNSPVLNDDGSLLCIVHRVEDVTEFHRLKQIEGELFLRSRELTEIKQLSRERELAEEQRHESENRFRLLAESITDVFWLTDFPQTRLLYVSPSVETVSGLSQTAFHDDLNAWRRLIHPEDAERVREAFERDMPEGTFNVEYRLLTLNGDLRWISDRAFPIRDASGNLYRVAGVAQDITARKRAEEIARSSEAEFRQVAESMPQLVWVTRPDGYHEWYNRQWYEYTGTTPAQAVGEGWTDFFHPEDQERAWARWRRSLASGESYEIEYRCKRHDGAYRWFLGRALPIRDDAGKILRWFGTCTDIHEQKTAAAHLLQQWHTFDTALSHTPDFTYVFDLEGRFTYVNRALLSLWQKPLEEARGRNFFELGYPEDLAGLLQDQIQQVIETREPVKDNTPFTGPTGETGFYEYIFVPIQSADGRVEAVAGSTRDITEREKMARALAESEQKLQRVFNEAPVGVAVLRGRQMVFELANPSYQHFFPGRELLGRPLLEAVPEISEEVLGVLEGVFNTGEPFIGHEYLIRLDRNDDGVVEDSWFTFVYQPLREADGSVNGIVVVAVDVGSHVRARRDLERVNRELEEFAYVASHDLQEPLRMVNIYSHLLASRFGSGSDTAEEYAGFIKKGVTRMESLIRDLLSYSRSSKQEELPVGVTHLSQAVGDALSVLDGRINENQATVTWDPLPVVHGDHTQLTHVFQNLVSNALKYRKPGVPPQIHIAVRQHGNEYIISVKDNGIGFEQQYAERIFGLFKRLHKEEYPGTGLGLAICQRIVERYGGRIWAESVLGEGSTFHLTLVQGTLL